MIRFEADYNLDTLVTVDEAMIPFQVLSVMLPIRTIVSSSMQDREGFVY